MTKECNVCAKNGHTGIMVEWKVMKKDDTGKVTEWKARNPDGSDHQHKQKAAAGGGQDWQERNEQIKQAHDENMKQGKELIEAIKDLASAIRTTRFLPARLANAPQQPEEDGPPDEEEDGPT